MFAINPSGLRALGRKIRLWWNNQTTMFRFIAGSLSIVLATVILCIAVGAIFCASNHDWCIVGPWAPPQNESASGFPDFQMDIGSVVNNFTSMTKFRDGISEPTALVADTGLPARESFITVYVNSSHFQSTLVAKSDERNLSNMQERANDNEPPFDESYLCLGSRLKNALDNQDPAYLHESPFQDYTMMYNERYWIPWQYSGETDELDPTVWGEFLQENFPNQEPQLIEYFWSGAHRTLLEPQAWLSMCDPSSGIQIVKNMFTSSQPVPGWPTRASDQLFLQWKQASTVKGNIGNIRWIGIQVIINDSTVIQLQLACPASLPTQNWPGCFFDWENNPRTANALLGSPNGRFIGWMLLQHPNEFPRKTVLNVRAFQASPGLRNTWNLLFEVGSLPEAAATTSSTSTASTTSSNSTTSSTSTISSTSSTRTTSSTTSTHNNAKLKRLEGSKDVLSSETQLVKRKTPEQCVCSGQSLIQRINTQTELTPSQFQDYAALTTSTWIIANAQRYPPAGWTQAFKALKICCGNWHYWYCTGAGDGLARGASYGHFYHLRSGTLLRGATYRAEVNNEDLGVPYKPSDITFLGWQHWCLQNKQSPNSLNRVLIDTVHNPDTKQTISWVLARKGMSSLPGWPGITLLPGSFEFMALLGTPNGISIGWMIINHAEALPRRTVTSITVFQGPTEPMVDFEIGTLPVSRSLTGPRMEDLIVGREDWSE